MHVLLSDIAQSFGLILFCLAFLLVLIYALSPSNKKVFDRAAHAALDEEGSDRDQD